MRNNKYLILAILSILFIAVRLLVICRWSPELFNFDELYIGTTAKEIIDGPVLSLYDYMPDSDHRGARLVAALLSVPFIALFGQSYFSLKIVAVFFSLGNLVLVYLFLWKFFRRSVAVIAGFLMIFPPALYTKFSLMMLRAHSELVLLTMAAVFIFYQIFFREHQSPPTPRDRFGFYAGKNISFVVLGIVCGLGVYFRSIFVVPLTACFLFWFIFDKLFFVRRSFFIFLISFLIGVGPLIHYNLTHNFAGLRSIFSHHFIASPLFLKPDILSYTYYGLFVISYCVLFWLNRSSIARLALGIIPSKKLHIMPSHTQREAFVLLYPLVFIMLYPLSAGMIRDSTIDYRLYMRTLLLTPFIFIIISLFLQRLWGISKGLGRVGVVVIFAVFLVMTAVGIKGEDNNAGGASSYCNCLRHEGYAYELVGSSIWERYGDNIQGVSELAYKYACPYRPFIFTGIGLGIGWRFFEHKKYRTITKCREIIGMFDESSRQYVLAGFGASMIRRNDIASTIALIDQMDEKDRPHLYRGVGWFIGLAFKENKIESIAVIDRVSQRYRPDCYRGVGELAGRVFTDVSFILPFLGTIPPEYQCAAFEGLAKPLGWRYEYFLKRDPADLVKEIPEKHQACFRKGLYYLSPRP